MSCTRRSTIQLMLSSSSPSMCRCVGIHSLHRQEAKGLQSWGKRRQSLGVGGAPARRRAIEAVRAAGKGAAWCSVVWAAWGGVVWAAVRAPVKVAVGQPLCKLLERRDGGGLVILGGRPLVHHREDEVDHVGDAAVGLVARERLAEPAQRVRRQLHRLLLPLLVSHLGARMPQRRRRRRVKAKVGEQVVEVQAALPPRLDAGARHEGGPVGAAVHLLRLELLELRDKLLEPVGGAVGGGVLAARDGDQVAHLEELPLHERAQRVLWRAQVQLLREVAHHVELKQLHRRIVDGHAKDGHVVMEGAREDLAAADVEWRHRRLRACVARHGALVQPLRNLGLQHLGLLARHEEPRLLALLLTNRQPLAAHSLVNADLDTTVVDGLEPLLVLDSRAEGRLDERRHHLLQNKSFRLPGAADTANFRPCERKRCRER
eukprot:539267-Prymnesium_polylepis.1